MAKSSYEIIIKDTHRGLRYEDGVLVQVLETGRSPCLLSGPSYQRWSTNSSTLKRSSAKIVKWSTVGALALICALGMERSSKAAAPPPVTDDSWTSLGGFPGALQGDGGVTASVTDGSGNLYVGGRFLLIGDTLATNVAKWDGSRWSALGTGPHDPFSYQCVLALAMDGSGNLYAGGYFTNAGGVSANSIAKWNGTTWSPLGDGVDGSISALIFTNGVLYAGGSFTRAGGVNAANVAKWDGSNWSALGTGLRGGSGPPVYALAVRGGELYAAGFFTKAGEQEVNRIAKWDGNNWSALGHGLDGSALALAVSGNDLYVGGTFTNAGGLMVNQIAKWDGVSWSALDTGMALDATNRSAMVMALKVSNGHLYAGGTFSSAGGVNATNVAQWDGSSWAAVGNGLPSLMSFGVGVRTITAFGDKLLAGGDFVNYGPKSLCFVAWWDGDEWLPVGDGVISAVSLLAVSPLALYVSIPLYTPTSTSVEGSTSLIMKRDGTNWTDLGVTIQGYVTAMLATGSDLYVAGAFTNVGSVQATNIAKWDGTNWVSLEGGTDGTVFSLAVDVSGNLHAAGVFAKAGGHAAKGIARWDGISWSEVGGGVDGTVYAVGIVDDLVYIGGSFTSVGGVIANNIARWDGAHWSALGSGLNGVVYGFEVSSSRLYAGGEFTAAGGISVTNGLATWDGFSWGPFGESLTNHIYNITVDGAGNVYVIGPFFIARWDGNEWSDISSGVNNEVRTIKAFEGGLYVGGYFTVIGGKVSSGVARADISNVEPRLAIRRTGGQVELSWPAALSGYGLEERGTLSNPAEWRPVTEPLVTANDRRHIKRNAAPASRFYRLRKQE